MDKIEEVLKELLNTGIGGTFEPNEYGRKKITQATLSLKSLIREKMLSEEEIIEVIKQVPYTEFFMEGHPEYLVKIEQTPKDLAAAIHTAQTKKCEL